MKFPTNKFEYNAAKRQFLAQAVDLGLQPPFPEELTLVSSETGREVGYRKSGEKKDPGTGTILGVGYVPTPDSLRKVKTCWGTRIVVICEA